MLDQSITYDDKNYTDYSKSNSELTFQVNRCHRLLIPGNIRRGEEPKWWKRLLVLPDATRFGFRNNQIRVDCSYRQHRDSGTKNYMNCFLKLSVTLYKC